VYKRSYFVLKAFALIAFFVAEMGFAAHLLHEQADEDTVQAVLEMPVVGQWYYNYRTIDIRKAASEGDVSAMLTLHKDAFSFDQLVLAEEAMNQIRMSASPTARLYTYEYDLRNSTAENPTERMSDRELQLLHARVMKENVRPDFQNSAGDTFIQQSQRNALALNNILEKARNGDENAQWLVFELNSQ
jgi:hypothetical protein